MPAALLGHGRRHGYTTICENKSLEQRRGLGASVGGALPWACLQDSMNLIPQRLTNNGFVLTGIARALMDSLANIDPVTKELVEKAFVDRLAPLVQGSVRDQLARQRRGGAQFNKPLEHVPHLGGFA